MTNLLPLITSLMIISFLLFCLFVYYFLFKTDNKKKLYLTAAASFLCLFICPIIYLVNFTPYQEATVVRIIDGDTIVANIDEHQEKIRLIGIDAPESVNPNKSLNSEQGILASQYLKTILSEGQLIYLTVDDNQERTDKYGRLLRYVWPSKQFNNPTNMINYQIIANGYATVNYYGNNRGKYLNEFTYAEQQYKKNNTEYIDSK